MSNDQGNEIKTSEDVTLLKQRIEAYPEDILSYLNLVKFYEKNEMYTDAREVYDTVNGLFPLYSPLWTMQLNDELIRDEFEIVEKKLAKCLSGDFENNDLALWSTYLDYVRRKNNIITGGQEARSVVIKAFDLVLEKCARFEPNSSSFWDDYLLFLEQWKPVNKWEEQQKVDMIRILYKKMLCVPFDNLEKMWSKYTQWEQDVNNLTARKFIGEISSDYMKARSLYQEWLNLTRGLKRSSASYLKHANNKTVPTALSQYEIDTIDGDATYYNSIKQLQIWLGWIDWEKENKLELPTEELQNRLIYVYKQGIQYMIYMPEIWYDYAMFTTDMTKRETILTVATNANTCSPSLVFKLIECHETKNNTEAVQNCFETCTASIMKQYQNSLLLANGDENDPTVYRIRHKLTYVYCIYMNTMKKLSGLSTARSVFGKCRKLKQIMTHDIYIENALLEFQNQSDYKTAFRVLELGLKYFQIDGVYINKYLDFLILLNKDAQIKTLFESSVTKEINQVHLKSIYKKMIAYESKYGNVDNVYALEKRYFETFPNEKRIELFTNRYQIQNENLLKKLELRYLYRDEPNESDPFELDNNSNPLKRSLAQDKQDEMNKRQKNGLHVPKDIIQLLSLLPKRQYFKTAFLDPKKLVKYINEQVELPKPN
ncbi:hypothetical protein TPHA_0N01630 [Tetrapisispora phaffii CBS 4417]|uniref:mRNA 3'-end-processing protein RNA14 n=1 Tax=Tetrapisispora phaffii (strain ATCC 24235 / CBS 4417 / NBRC 1672 / NRRL Y-8282 / UCD 70-5) TaxID=1071381 RepID=G8C1B6_TETPH|nr:hypothetical protein TPHA_0N01630 [Tetrapisispora phaffii CBS 4417]CCE65944.1 hypothetical protein TPHA_0N01630 [Tetrapisispora phaffii CBS 4417]